MRRRWTPPPRPMLSPELDYATVNRRQLFKWLLLNPECSADDAWVALLAAQPQPQRQAA